MKLLIPKDDCPKPQVSIVIPALNESRTIAQFVEWCHQGIRACGLPGEILIVDSSTDATAEIAHTAGARVLKTPKRGLGRAYIDAIPYIRGNFVMLGDCDCTYDFRELTPFIRELQAGAEFVMGTRMRGSIEPGSMPKLHQYFGTPLTTALLNFMYSSNFSDIHCGMRALTKSAFTRMQLRAQTWEYASEMIIKAIKLGMRTAEVPIKFYKDVEGRSSHLKLMGWWGPWLAGWQTLRVFSLFKPDFFLRKPGLVLFLSGFFGTFILAAGPWSVGGVTLSIYTQILSLFLLIVGGSFLHIDALTTLHLGYDAPRCKMLLRYFHFDKAVPMASLLLLLGLGIVSPTFFTWINSSFALHTMPHHFIAGIGIALVGMQLFLVSLTVTLLATRDYQEGNLCQELQTIRPCDRSSHQDADLSHI